MIAGWVRWGALGACLMALSTPAGAYDAATTHAGLTEKAVLASDLHRALTASGRALGLLEPLQIHSRTMPADARQALWGRLSVLDPAGGYRPDAEGSASALAWIVAGAVLAETPPERGRRNFLDPHGKTGIDGEPSALVWVSSPSNEQGLPAFWDHLERSVTGETAATRESALVQALLAMGGILAVLENVGEPAHVRRDVDGAFSFERFVSARYGRAGLPAPGKPVRRPNVESYFTANDGLGLADRTHRNFFSAGTLPGDVPVGPRTTTRDVIEKVKASLEFPRPAVTGLDLKQPGKKQYLVADGRKVLGYWRDRHDVRFVLDEAVHTEAAKALMPEIGAYAAGLIDHLWRGRVVVSVEDGTATVAVEGVTDVKKGVLRVFVEDTSGKRRPLPAPAEGAPSPASPLILSDLPTGTKKVAAVFRGEDRAGSFVAVGEASIP